MGDGHDVRGQDKQILIAKKTPYGKNENREKDKGGRVRKTMGRTAMSDPEPMNGERCCGPWEKWTKGKFKWKGVLTKGGLW